MARAASRGPLPCQAWAGEGAWVPAALKGLNALALSSQPPQLGLGCVFSSGPLSPNPLPRHPPPPSCPRSVLSSLPVLTFPRGGLAFLCPLPLPPSPQPLA